PIDGRWRVGTIGFSYEDWRGVFYPKGLDPKRRLAWYAQRFGAIELDTTFYATPAAGTVQAWAEAVPAGFRFAVKASREITHDPGTGGPGAADRLTAFIGAMRGGLGDKLGVVLLQFPASVTFELHGDAVMRLIEGLPRGAGGPAYAVEWRHGSWWTRGMAEWMRGLNAQGLRLAWVGADYPTPDAAAMAPDGPASLGVCRPPALVHTGEVAYVRWVGNHGQLPASSAEVLDPTARLAWWVDRLAAYTAPEAPVRDVYGFFGNSYAGHAPATCRRFAELMGWADTGGLGGAPEPTLFGEPDL
ncbi:MAG: DUF72 domain-containing protein, partial [Planctomycetota bacterium]